MFLGGAKSTQFVSNSENVTNMYFQGNMLRLLQHYMGGDFPNLLQYYIGGGRGGVLGPHICIM